MSADATVVVGSAQSEAGTEAFVWEAVFGKRSPREVVAALGKTFLERDLPQIGISVGSVAMRRFWSMIAHYHGQTWNSSELARAFGVSDTTTRRWLDLLAPPSWFACSRRGVPTWASDR